MVPPPRFNPVCRRRDHPGLLLARRHQRVVRWWRGVGGEGGGAPCAAGNRCRAWLSTALITRPLLSTPTPTVPRLQGLAGHRGCLCGRLLLLRLPRPHLRPPRQAVIERTARPWSCTLPSQRRSAALPAALGGAPGSVPKATPPAARCCPHAFPLSAAPHDTRRPLASVWPPLPTGLLSWRRLVSAPAARPQPPLSMFFLLPRAMPHRTHQHEAFSTLPPGRRYGTLPTRCITLVPSSL